ncbi:MAG: hypothetical protein GF320_14585 [Armatimonadia bacterium]|nr:hypothetical protein [Armatimonadia bacterium]
MRPLQRVHATVRGDPRDHAPNQPLLMSFAVAHHGVTYEEYVKDHRTLVAAQLRVADDFDVDVVTCCSDAWREAGDLGAELSFYDREPPGCKTRLLPDKKLLASLTPVAPENGPRMSDRIAAVEALAGAVGGEIEVDGWVEGPVAQAANLRGVTEFMLDTLDDPRFAAELMDWVTELEVSFARAQIAAGADAIGIGDAASSLVSPEFYESHVLPRIGGIVGAIHEEGALARLHVCGDTTHLLPHFGRLGVDIIEVDSLVDFAGARRKVGDDVTLLGNLNPVAHIQEGSPETIKAELQRCYDVARPRYIVGAGCEIPAGTSPENLRALAEFARSVT